MTADFQIDVDARVLITVPELLKQLLLSNQNFLSDLDCLILDEFHFIQEESRGGEWESILLLLPPRGSIIALSATIDQPEVFVNWINQRRLTNSSYASMMRLITPASFARPIPLRYHVVVSDHDLKSVNPLLLSPNPPIGSLTLEDMANLRIAMDSSILVPDNDVEEDLCCSFCGTAFESQELVISHLRSTKHAVVAQNPKLVAFFEAENGVLEGETLRSNDTNDSDTEKDFNQEDHEPTEAPLQESSDGSIVGLADEECNTNTDANEAIPEELEALRKRIQDGDLEEISQIFKSISKESIEADETTRFVLKFIVESADAGSKLSALHARNAFSACLNAELTTGKFFFSLPLSKHLLSVSTKVDALLRIACSPYHDSLFAFFNAMSAGMRPALLCDLSSLFIEKMVSNPSCYLLIPFIFPWLKRSIPAIAVGDKTRLSQLMQSLDKLPLPFYAASAIKSFWAEVNTASNPDPEHVAATLREFGSLHESNRRSILQRLHRIQPRGKPLKFRKVLRLLMMRDLLPAICFVLVKSDCEREFLNCDLSPLSSDAPERMKLQLALEDYKKVEDPLIVSLEEKFHSNFLNGIGIHHAAMCTTFFDTSTPVLSHTISIQRAAGKR
jgi:hypothetical protein